MQCQITPSFRTGTIVDKHRAVKNYHQLSKFGRVLVRPYIIILKTKHFCLRVKFLISRCRGGIVRFRRTRGAVCPILIPKLMALSKYTHRYSILAHRPVTDLEIMDLQICCQNHADSQGRISAHSQFKQITIAHKILRKSDSSISINSLTPCPGIYKPRTPRPRKYKYHREVPILIPI